VAHSHGDAEIAIDAYGVPPRDVERLVLGHDSLGEVIEALKVVASRRGSGRRSGAAARSCAMPG
jgi:hypothetical protein